MISIKLTKEDKQFLKKLINCGKQKVRTVARANVLILLDKGWNNESISMSTGVHRQGIWRIKKRFLEENVESAVFDKPRPGQPKKYSKNDEAEIIALACTKAPKGRKRWSIRLLTDKLKKTSNLKGINRESVRMVLKKVNLSLG